MCTAVTYKTKNFYFGRTLDYQCSYGEEVVVTPRNYAFEFRHMGESESHYAIIGMAHVAEGVPLYYDAVNEKGLCIAGLNFVGNAAYKDLEDGKDNVAQFELIPWILCRCAAVKEAKELLAKINITNTPFSESLPPAQLHWIIADKDEAVTLECMKDGIHIYDNEAGVLTNNPPFDKQCFNLNNYMHLSSESPSNAFSDKLSLETYCHGMGALGLPGDWSSQSRFVRAAFVKANSHSGDSEEDSLSQFFHIMETVQQPRGCSSVGNGEFEVTLYTSCCNAEKGIYYYTTYNNRRITAVDMRREDLQQSSLVRYSLSDKQEIKTLNRI